MAMLNDQRRISDEVFYEIPNEIPNKAPFFLPSSLFLDISAHKCPFPISWLISRRVE